MVASRDIRPGEVIFKESPITFGPMDTSRPVCLGCYQTVTKFSPKCNGCHFPCCSDSCSQNDQVRKFDETKTKNHLNDYSCKTIELRHFYFQHKNFECQVCENYQFFSKYLKRQALMNNHIIMTRTHFIMKANGYNETLMRSPV